MAYTKVAKPTATYTKVGKPVMYDLLLKDATNYFLVRAGVRLIAFSRGNTWDKVAKPAIP